MTSPQRVALLLDEMFSPTIAEELRRRGHDVVAVAADPPLRAMTDEELYVWAAEHDRCIVTENVKDFRRVLTHMSEPAGAGLLFTSSRTFPRRRRATGALIAALEAWLTHPGVAGKPPEDWLLPAPDHEAQT